MLLPEREQAADHDRRHHRGTHLGHALAGVGPGGDEGQRGRKPQDDRDEAEQLAGETQERRLPLGRPHPVRTIVREPPYCASRRSASAAPGPIRCRAECLQGRRRRQAPDLEGDVGAGGWQVVLGHARSVRLQDAKAPPHDHV